MASRWGATPVRVWWMCVAVLCLVLLAPLLLTDVPPLLDYPNHLARLTILAANGADPILDRFYVPRWGIIPDLAIDVLGTPLLWVLPVHVAGRIILGVVLLLPVLGTLAYGRAVAGRLTLWPLGSGLVAYNGTFLQGFLNFNASLGVALLLAAAWLRWREDAPRRTLLLLMPGAVVLFFCHLMGLLFLALLIAAHDLSVLLPLRRDPAILARAVLRRVAFALLVFALPMVLYATSELHAMTGDIDYLTASGKLTQLLIPFVNYVLPLDIATGVLVAAGLALCIITGRLRVPARAWIALGLVTLLYCAVPFGFKGTFALDTRFVVLLGFLVFACVCPNPERPHSHPWVGWWFGSVLVALFVVRMAVLDVAWLGHNQDLVELRTVMTGVCPGSTVLVADAPADYHPVLSRRLSNDARTDTHLPALLLIERRAWWPFLFDNASQQPVATREPYRSLSERLGPMPSHQTLARPGRVDLRGFDFVLLMGAGAVEDLATYGQGRLRLLVATQAAALFAVRPYTACLATNR